MRAPGSRAKARLAGTRRRGWQELAAEIDENYLIHKFKKGRERYKVFPRQRDRATYLGLLDRDAVDPDSRVRESHAYHLRRIEAERVVEDEATARAFFEILATRLDFVSITLDQENPYKIFRSLNSTGADLEEGDLIRNHVFMSVPLAEQDSFDDVQWRGLERHFDKDGKFDGKQFAAFLRDVLMQDGTYVGKSAVFEAFEERHPLAGLQATDLVKGLREHADEYDVIRGNAPHSVSAIDAALQIVRDLNVSTAYPLILTLFSARKLGKLTDEGLARALLDIGGFVLRRYVCGESSRAYGRWFCGVCRDLDGDPLARLETFLRDKGWPSDDVFIPKFLQMNLYGSEYSNAVLTGLERSLQAASERVDISQCTIEHVLPQTIVDDEDGKAWQAALGEEWRRVYGEWVHTPGNLTLVGYDYNIGMSNRAFTIKKPILAASKVYLNKHFANSSLSKWDEVAIKERGRGLAERACTIWLGPKTV